MPKLLAARAAQYVMEAEFVFSFDDTIVPVSGGTPIVGTSEVDFGKTNIVATVVPAINLPQGAVIVGGSLTTETAFDTASFTVSVGDSGSAARYLAAADRKAPATVALLTPGYRSEGENLTMTITNADVCTAGKATLRVLYITTGRANEANPN